LTVELATCTRPAQQQQLTLKNAGTVLVTTFYIPQSKSEDSARQWKTKTVFPVGECPAYQAEHDELGEFCSLNLCKCTWSAMGCNQQWPTAEGKGSPKRVIRFCSHLSEHPYIFHYRISE